MTRRDHDELAFSYLRFSSLAQSDGDSLRRQNSLRDGWLKRHPGVNLDTTLSLVDAGVSGFTGQHRLDPRHAFAGFQSLVGTPRVPVGSYLIVENLDRLTRENPIVAIPAVLSLIAAGIRIVQLAPTEIVYDAEMDQGKLMMLLWELARGHGESKRKSQVVGEAWGEKKAQARAGRPHGKAVPAWLELVGGVYREREPAASTVRYLFRLSREGVGLTALCRRLEAEGVPPISGKRWVRAYVNKILTSRTVLGEYQPMRGHRRRVPDGEPVAGYFPAVVSEADFFAAQSAAAARRCRSGRPASPRGEHPWQGLLTEATTGCRLWLRTRRDHRGKNPSVCPYIVSAAGMEYGGRGEPFRADVFTGAVLGRLRELAASDLFADPSAARVAELEGRKESAGRKLAAAIEQFEAVGEDPRSIWARKVTQYDQEVRDLEAQIRQAEREAAAPLPALWREAVALMAQQQPLRLRQALLATVEGIWCVPVHRGEERLCAVQVWFKGQPQRHREYLILYRAHQGEEWACRDLAEVCREGELDLRQPEAAARLAEELRSSPD